MTEEQKESLQEIEEQLYTINARNISLPWIGMKKTPTMDEISQLNKLLGFIILEMRTLRETGKMNKEALHKKEFGDV